MAKKKPGSLIQGRWRIDSVSMLDDEYLHEEVEAFIRFGDNDSGSFQFGYLRGEIDYRITERGGKPAVEFSWEGGDAADATPLIGRGWAVLDDDRLEGTFYIHRGDESEFVAKRSQTPKRKRKQACRENLPI